MWPQEDKELYKDKAGSLASTVFRDSYNRKTVTEQILDKKPTPRANQIKTFLELWTFSPEDKI